jgi:uncharacterized protein (DUF486 family)
MTITKQNLSNLIANGKTEQAITQLRMLSPQLEKDLQEDILIQSNKFKTYQKEKRQETTTKEDLQVKLNKINIALLEIIHQLPNANLDVSKNFTIKGLKWALGIVIIMIFLAALAIFFRYNLRSLFTSNEDKIETPDQPEQTKDTNLQTLPATNINDGVPTTPVQEVQQSDASVKVINTNKFTFSGVVKDEIGFLKNVYIKIGNQSVYTDEKGEFEIKLKSDTEEKLKAIMPGYEPYSTYTIPKEDIIITLKKLNQ